MTFRECIEQEAGKQKSLWLIFGGGGCVRVLCVVFSAKKDVDGGSLSGRWRFVVFGRGLAGSRKG